MANGQCFQHRRMTFTVTFVFILICYSEIVKAQHNWFRPTTTTKRPATTSTTTTTAASSKIKRHPETRNSPTVVFPEGILYISHVALISQSLYFGSLLRNSHFLKHFNISVNADEQDAGYSARKMHQQVG